MILLFPCFSYKRHCSDLFSLPSLPKYPVKLSCIPRTLEAVFSRKFVNYPASATSFITKSSNPKEVLSTFVLVRTIVCLYNVDCNESTSLIQPLFIIKVDYKTKACIVEHMIVFLTFTNGISKKNPLITIVYNVLTIFFCFWIIIGHFSPVGKNKHNTNSGVVVNGTIICFCCPQIKGGTKVSRCIWNFSACSRNLSSTIFTGSLVSVNSSWVFGDPSFFKYSTRHILPFNLIYTT